MTTTRRHDSNYKRLFSHKEMVADLISGYVDAKLAGTFDLSSLERCNGTYISPDLRERHNDVVWRLNTTDGTVYVYLLLEFQSTVDPFMAVRLLGYIALLWQDLIAQHQLCPGDLLPPVLPIVLYNGDQPWTAPLSLRRIIAPGPAALRRLQPTASYLFLDENHLPTAPGLALHNLSAAIFALEQSQGLAAQHRVIRALRAWLKDRPDLREVFGTWIATALIPTGLLPPTKRRIISLDEVEPMMATRILQDIKRQVDAGIAKGEAKGKAEGKVELIRELVRTGVLPIDAARNQVRSLVKSKQITARAGRSALARLG